jgi:hypothetical protein
MASKYTYDNWLKGEVTLVYSTRMFDKGDEPKLADWDDFTESDIERIKEKQWEIYAEKVNTLLKAHSVQFTKRFNASEMKNEYFNDEIQECKNIMFGTIPNAQVVHLKHWGIGLDHQYLLDIQYYIDRTIKKGIDDGLDFIHSPNCKYEDKSKPDSRIYARFVWEYCKWLESLAVKEQKEEIKDINASEVKANISANSDEIKQKSLWFNVGLLFANGEMDKLLLKHKQGTQSNYSAIAKELGNSNYRPYISESVSNTNIGNKNIFSSPSKISFIEEYCKLHNISIVDSFKIRKSKY